MGRNGIVNYLKVNQSLTVLGTEIREFRLPRVNPFPKLQSSAVRPTNSEIQQFVPSRLAAGRSAVMIRGDIGSFPEMATDVIDVSAGYAVQNVRRERSYSGSWSRMGFGHLVGRMLGHRAARP
jgi:hypothetical protein